ncbi:chromatin target of PRMT1 protein [Silurus meridionalis]|uniref:Chromatin target of PRMT1 protein C-terminal domain-containing protein n=2 Tax=Silurus TaxID=94992 RepID=A0A8T0A407_SILME|nr:hypothetical protein HF521_015824 [Silurus meridionalis]KAI5087482.1 chromatin target of PRMT1 protein [Silurus meridionalis]
MGLNPFDWFPPHRTGPAGEREKKMSSPSTQKFVLKSTTKVSLNERFTNMMKNKQPTAVSIRATMQQQHMASARNRRLAQQMENRPSVQAALQHKQSLKQRLGKSNIQARLGRPIGSLMRGAVGGRGFGVPGMRGAMRGLRGRGRGSAMRGALVLRGQLKGRGGPGRLGIRRGMRQRGGATGRGAALIGRGAARGGAGPRGRGGLRGRGGFLGRGRGRGGRGGRGAGRPVVTREQLDNQLDAYMSKTKGHLDAELDAYMAQADPESME